MQEFDAKNKPTAKTQVRALALRACAPRAPYAALPPFSLPALPSHCPHSLRPLPTHATWQCNSMSELCLVATLTLCMPGGCVQGSV